LCDSRRFATSLAQAHLPGSAMPRPILATVHPEALEHNLNQARVRAPDARVWAVVKANAYGHGIERVFPALRSTDGFAMIDLAEAERVRALDWRGPLLLLEGVFEPRDLELCSRLNIWHAVHCTEQIDWLAAHKTHTPHRVFLKLNSGMNRLGFRPDAFRAAWARLNALPQVEEISLMTHFSDADGPRGIAHQVAAFEAATADLPGERSLCNSAAILRHANTPLRGAGVSTLAADWVREGIALYGGAPDHPENTAAGWGLKPTMSLTTKVIGVQSLQPGDTVGYGSAFTAEQPMRVGVIGERRAHPHRRPRQHGHDHRRPGAAGRRRRAGRHRQRGRALGRLAVHGGGTAGGRGGPFRRHHQLRAAVRGRAPGAVRRAGVEPGYHTGSFAGPAGHQSGSRQTIDCIPD